MQPDCLARLHDALDACETIDLYLRGKHLHDYLADKMMRQATERSFEILGEALNAIRRADPELAARIPDAPQAIDFRNLLIHGYAIIKHEVVWRTAVEDLPRIRQQLHVLLNEHTRPQ